MKIGGQFDTHPAADAFPMMEPEAFEQLADDIKANGLEDEIVMIREGKREFVLDGRNRLKACIQVRVKPRFTWYDGKDPVGYVISLNLRRRHLNESQRAMIAAKLETIGHGGSRRQLASCSEPTRAKVAKQLTVGERSVARAKTVLERAAPEVVKAVEDGALTVSAAAEMVALPKDKQREIAGRVKANEEGRGARPGFVRSLVRKEQRRELAAKLNAEPLPMPAGPFRVIVADPPWDYTKRDGDATHRMLSYATMSTDQICALDVAARAHEDGCILWLWTTNAFMRDAYRVLDAWGFQEKTILTWAKNKMGLGDWLRGKTEHAILAVRGKPTHVLHNESTLLEAAVREHSRKPDEFYELVERMCPGGKLEMFAREPRSGWSCWGAEPELFAKGAA